MFRIVFLLALSLSAAVVAEPIEPWELVLQQDDVKVWRRDRQDSNIYAHKVEALVRASSARVWQTIRDVPHYAQYMPYVIESRVLSENGNTRLVYQRLAPPIVSDRDYTIRLEALADPELGVYEERFELAANEGPPPGDAVRVLVIEGRWLVEPISQRLTRVVYELHTDPGGWIPNWVVNFVQKRTFPDMVESLQQRSRDQTWRR